VPATSTADAKAKQLFWEMYGITSRYAVKPIGRQVRSGSVSSANWRMDIGSRAIGLFSSMLGRIQVLWGDLPVKEAEMGVRWIYARDDSILRRRRLA
jgi:hypothetical protein